MEIKCKCGFQGTEEEYLFEEYHEDSKEFSCVECGSIIEVEN